MGLNAHASTGRPDITECPRSLSFPQIFQGLTSLRVPQLCTAALARQKDSFPMQRRSFILPLCLLVCVAAFANVFGRIQGVVHDPQHRPLAGAQVTLKSADSAYTLTVTSDASGVFQFAAVPLGKYKVTVIQNGFEQQTQPLTLLSNTSPVLHFELAISTLKQSVTVAASGVNDNTVTPTTLVSRLDIQRTPGADRTYSMQSITDYTPGAYMTHDMLHMRGGHQVTFQIDGVQIPQTNIASNLGPQIDPKDIDTMEIQRGSYTADEGDRTYGIFNVATRNGFERNNEAELELSAGNFYQTNDQLSFGSHTEKFAYYASLNGNRTDYGLAPPIAQTYHDAANGYGAFTSLIYNQTPQDQYRFVGSGRTDYFQIPYDPDPNSDGNQIYDSSGLRDAERETDQYNALTWEHTFSPRTIVQVSPMYHYNLANYNPNPLDTPNATTEHRTSQYAGGQASFATELANNYFQAGVFGFGQHDSLLFAVNPGLSPQSASVAGELMEAFLSDNYKVTSWLTLLGGIRQSHFAGGIIDNFTAPRVGMALEVPKLHWVFRGFYGRFYQVSPLVTLAGPVLQYANQNNTSIVPLHGERDEEHQFGVQIPLPTAAFKGWILDADTFKTRVNNFLDHNNIGESSIYVPITVDGALVRAWELTLRSPQIPRVGAFHLAYSNQIAEQRGNITGGLICVPVGDPACDAGFAYTPVDHDQRNTLSVGFNGTLPWHAYASTNVTYGSGFSNGAQGSPGFPTGPYLAAHESWDLSAGKEFGERLTGSVTILNTLDQRTLLDTSLTFGGFHYSDPRQVYAEVRYRFKY
jgi:hypothetical protein